MRVLLLAGLKGQVACGNHVGVESCTVVLSAFDSLALV